MILYCDGACEDLTDLAVCSIVGIFVSYLPPSADGVLPKLGSLVVLLETRSAQRLSAT